MVANASGSKGALVCLLFACALGAVATSEPAVGQSDWGEYYQTLQVAKRGSGGNYYPVANPSHSGTTVIPLPQGEQIRITAQANHFEGHASNVIVHQGVLSGVTATLTTGFNEVHVNLNISANAAPGARQIQVNYPVGSPGRIDFEVFRTPRVASWVETGSSADGQIRVQTFNRSFARYTFPGCEAREGRVEFRITGLSLDDPSLVIECPHCQINPLTYQGAPSTSA